MIEYLSQPWPWYVAGPLITLVMWLLLRAGGEFGVSSTLRSICAIGGAGRCSDFFRFDWRSQSWNLVFILGALLGGFISHQFLANPAALDLSPATIADLQALGISFDGDMAPDQIFSVSSLSEWKTWMILIIGGFLVGFGTRWAGGCTSGHAISGLSNLQLPSLIAVIGFFIGGLIMTFLIFPYIFS